MDRPDDPDLSPDDETVDPFADAPDPWAESDRSWDARWSDDPDADAPDISGDTAPVDGEPHPREPAFRPPPREPAHATHRRGNAYGFTPGPVSNSYLDGMQGAGPYLGLGMQIAGSMLVFVGGGYGLDRWLGSSPVWTLVGAALGMAGIVALVVRIARDADAQNAARKANAKAKK